MQQDTPEDVLRACINRLGGMKSVAVLLRPEFEERPEAAGRWLSDCLNDDKREKLSLQQVIFLLRRARDAGFHEAQAQWNRLCGYGPSAPLAPDVEAAEMRRQFMDHVGRTERLLAAMRARGLDMEGVE